MNAKFKNKLFYLSIFFNLLFICLIVIFLYRLTTVYNKPYRFGIEHIEDNICKYIRNKNGKLVQVEVYNKNNKLDGLEYFYDGQVVYSLNVDTFGKIKNRMIYYTNKKKKFVLLDKDNDGIIDKKLEQLQNGERNSKYFKRQV